MATKKTKEEKNYNPGNVIFSKQNVFYDEIFTIHADLVRKGAELDERNIGFYIDYLHSFVSGYNAYLPEKDAILKQIQKMRDKLSDEKYLKLTWNIFENGILSLGSSEFIKYKKIMSSLKIDLFSIFEEICKNLPKMNIFPKELQESYTDDDYFS